MIDRSTESIIDELYDLTSDPHSQIPRPLLATVEHD